MIKKKNIKTNIIEKSPCLIIENKIVKIAMSYAHFVDSLSHGVNHTFYNIVSKFSRLLNGYENKSFKPTIS